MLALCLSHCLCLSLALSLFHCGFPPPTNTLHRLALCYISNILFLCPQYPSHSCLPILVFRLDAHLHIETRWLPEVSVPPAPLLHATDLRSVSNKKKKLVMKDRYREGDYKSGTWPYASIQNKWHRTCTVLGRPLILYHLDQYLIFLDSFFFFFHRQIVFLGLRALPTDILYRALLCLPTFYIGLCSYRNFHKAVVVRQSVWRHSDFTYIQVKSTWRSSCDGRGHPHSIYIVLENMVP